ncbi:HAD domain-containing protein [Kitasatospora sp. NPDC088346]|uniref:HAD domain-containing protein n=1 Tax=Kitasatospora sp. NPDC088346 TaxID=3364073 RepID=UPI00382073CD
MHRPLLFVDVDGVLNPECPYPDTGFDRHHLLGHTVLVSGVHGAWLRELAAAYQLVWATTWEEHANLHLSPLLGLEQLPVVRFTGYVPQPDDPKVPVLDVFSARKWAPIVRYAEGRPFAWIDDVIPSSLLRRTFLRRDRVLLRIEAGQGLQRRHVDRLLTRPPMASRLRALNRDQSTRH